LLDSGWGESMHSDVESGIGIELKSKKYQQKMVAKGGDYFFAYPSLTLAH